MTNAGKMPHQARAVMVLGTSSGAGKSWLTTALCRWYARQGLKIAPYKAQNMSNNARVVPGPDGVLGEIGSAQYFQALAAGAVPDVRMNPVLLKPEHDTASQVVVMGRVRRDYSSMPWRSRSELLWPHAREALHALMAEHDVVVIEGAGSPAEINLHDNDFVNMRTALAARAACLLVTDIDRGGAFAHLYGTHQLLPAHERALFKGFVLNRFRGDASLLSPGPEQLQAMTGVPTLAVLPMARGHGLPEEDGVYDDGFASPAWAPGADAASAHASGSGPRRIAIVAYPRISNIDEFQALRNLPGVRLVWARHPSDLDGADWVILPGSKHTRGDLAWLRAQRLDVAIGAHACKGGAVLGICGGLQMLGETVHDPDGIEGAGQGDATSTGLGLLPLRTQFAGDKSLRHTQVTCLAQYAGHHGGLPHASGAASQADPWRVLHGQAFSGYEIHHGRTIWQTGPHAHAPDAIVQDELGQPLGWQRGPILGLYLHGLFESPVVMRALFGQHARVLDDVFDGLADLVDRHFEPGSLMRLLQP